jgi:aromatic-L-amino-acid decarboxylase
MRERFAALERTARSLEPSPEDRRILRDAVVDYTEKFIDEIYTLPAYNVTEDKGKEIYASPIEEEPMAVAEALRIYAHNVDRPGLNPASHGHLAYIPGGGIYVSAIADYLADITNRYAGVFYGGPGAVRMENMLDRKSVV